MSTTPLSVRPHLERARVQLREAVAVGAEAAVRIGVAALTVTENKSSISPSDEQLEKRAVHLSILIPESLGGYCLFPASICFFDLLAYSSDFLDRGRENASYSRRLLLSFQISLPWLREHECGMSEGK